MLACRLAGWLGVLGAVSMLLVGGGCGCTDDSGGFVQTVRNANAQIGVLIAPKAVRAPSGPTKVDVMFLLDDSFFITQRTMQPGQNAPIGAITGDGRIKTDVAQAVFANAVDELKARLVADGLGTADDFDLAFGMSRFEDYANFVRSMPDPTSMSVPPAVAAPVDGLARPFILNQPILREAHPLFATLFSDALERETPGNGGSNPQDPQAALEALYQLATGAGFDGDGNGSTEDSGPVGVVATQTNPGTSGDVPAFAATDNGVDTDGEPVYQVGGTIASGNLGGAGWRPDSIRLIVMFTDIATVTPLLAGVTPDAQTGLYVYPISNTPSPTDQGPRPTETITSVQAFAALAGTPEVQAQWRFNAEDQTPAVAPDGAATLEGTIDALNESDIEMLGIGLSRAIQGGPTKPNLPGPTLPGEVPAVQDPSQPPQDYEAFTFLSAIAILSGARDTDATDPDSRFVPGLPLVYNLTTLSPLGGSITDDLVEDLSDRVGAWLPYKQTTDTEGEDPGSVFYTLTLGVTNPSPELTLNPSPGFPIVPDVDPGGSDPIYVSQNGAVQVVRVPCYFEGDTPPASVRVAWGLTVQRSDPEDLAERLAALEVSISSVLTPEAEVPGGQNPTGPHQGDLSLTDLLGTVSVVFPERTLENGNPISTSTLTSIDSGEALFRDVERNIPEGTSIFTMAGPLTNGDLPFPAP